MIIDAIISAMLIMGGIFGLIGSYGLLKLPDLMTRLHAPTKASTLGVGGVLIAAMLYAFFKENHVSWHELLITLFIFLTAPVTASFIAKAYIARNLPKGSLPPTGTSQNWATLETANPTDTKGK